MSFRYIFNTDIVPNGGQVQDKSLTRQAMIALLHDFDDQLDFDLRLEICGASSAILNHGLNRSSRDIDVLRSSVPLTDPKIQEKIKHGDQKTIKAEMAYRTKRSPEREVKHDPDL